METPRYRCIGRGNCGSVWALEGTQDSVYKREDGSHGRSILNDQKMHRRVIVAEDDDEDDDEDDPDKLVPVRIPRSYDIIEASDEWWQDSLGLSRFPLGFEACRTYHMERIPAMPQPVRQMLIDKYCPEGIRAFVSTNRDDEDCLVRTYLGRRRIGRQARFQRFSLRNYPLHVDQMEALGIDTHSMARTLADALAHCLWRASVDANDVEFVFAPERGTHEPEISLFKAFGDEYPIWMLDYDCCRAMTQDPAGVEQAVKAFYRNDPYYPRPYAHGYTEEDSRLWKTFRTRFLETSDELLKRSITQPYGSIMCDFSVGDIVWGLTKGTDKDPTRLATLFIEKVEEEGRKRKSRESKSGLEPSLSEDIQVGGSTC